MNITTSLLSTAIIAGSVLLTACGGDSDNASNPNLENNNGLDYIFKVEVTNLTYAQPLSPPALVLHNDSYTLFAEGTTASIALEELAESGSNSTLLQEAQSYNSVFHTLSGDSIILPGSSQVFTLSLEADFDHDLGGNLGDELDTLKLSLITMLVNTNDGFTGEKNIDLSSLEVNQYQTYNGPVWDSGTEENSESSDSIPGPAANGEGFNASRENDVNKVVFHSGVVSMDDGLASSSLTQAHRFNQPASRIKITRVQ